MAGQRKARRHSLRYRVVDVFTENPLESGNPRQPLGVSWPRQTC